MDKYYKGRNVEEPVDASNIPIPNLPADFLWMHVKGSSKLRNLLTYAFAKFPSEVSAVVWTGSGPVTSKVISCAEIMKRKFQVYQITKICYRRIDEYWEPQDQGLDQIVVNRNIPTIHILLSVNPLNSNESGYQAPGKVLECTKRSEQSKQVGTEFKKQRQTENSDRRGPGGDSNTEVSNRSLNDTLSAKRKRNRPKNKKNTLERTKIAAEINDLSVSVDSKPQVSSTK